MKKVFVLTFEVNEYNQEGGYFLAVFSNKPNREQLSKVFKNSDNYLKGYLENAIEDLLKNGGGRKDEQDVWFNLEEIEVIE